MAEFQNIELSVDGAVATITINRPKALNALNADTLNELFDAFGHTVESAARGVVLTGAGRAFVAGADISQMVDFTKDQAYAFARQGQALMTEIEALPIPVVAAVNGFALGGGCELAMACDVIYASEEAKFGQPEVKLGLIPGFGGTQRLSRLVGTQKARELVLSGRLISATEAYEAGLVARIVKPHHLLQEATALIAAIAKVGPKAAAAAKRVIQAGYHLPLSEANELEAGAFGDLFDSGEPVVGMTAFLAKREPEF